MERTADATRKSFNKNLRRGDPSASRRGKGDWWREGVDPNTEGVRGLNYYIIV